MIATSIFQQFINQQVTDEQLAEFKQAHSFTDDVVNDAIATFNIVKIGFTELIDRRNNDNVITDNSQEPWYKSTVDTLHLCVQSYNSYKMTNPFSINFKTASFVLKIVELLCPYIPDTFPSIVPGERGDCSIEWHTLKGDVELYVHPRMLGTITAWHKVVDQPIDDTEYEVNDDLTMIIDWLNDIK